MLTSLGNHTPTLTLIPLLFPPLFEPRCSACLSRSVGPQLGEDSYDAPPYEDEDSDEEEEEEEEYDAAERYRRRHGAAEQTGDQPEYDAETQAAVDGRWSRSAGRDGRAGAVGGRVTDGRDRRAGAVDGR